ncbi:TetR/AcrR family transcriptional regulator [Streptomyces vietnamensis]|uniref:TetR/AcrR family transcriptional regulator n=1 Tax=Streptomyces vietnamensis TaxID=362257 RepID=UPI0034205BD0
MPRLVDPEERVREIVAASIDALSDGGLQELTLRKVAGRMGGSITLITHYFATRKDLLNAILEYVLSDADAFIGELEKIEDPHERLKASLEWFLPLTPETLTQERARVALLSHQGKEPLIRQHLQKMEPAMQEVLACGINELVPVDERDGMVDVLRVWVSGIALSAVEHPEMWTAERQLATLERFIALLPTPRPITS